MIANNLTVAKIGQMGRLGIDLGHTARVHHGTDVSSK